MKTNLFTILRHGKSILMTVGLITLLSCNTIITEKTEERIYNARIKTLDKITSYYQKFFDKSFVEQSQLDLMVIFSKNIDSSWNVLNLDTFNMQLQVKISQYNILKKIYADYEILKKADKKHYKEQSDSLIKYYNTIIAIKDVNDTIKSKMGKLKPLIGKADSTFTISYHEKILISLADIYENIWYTEEFTVQHKDYLYKMYEDKVSRLPVSIFDPQKLKEVLNQPFSDVKILVDLYKMQLIYKIRESKAKTDKDIEMLNSAMKKMIALNTELAKGKIINSEILKILEELEK